MADHKKYRKHNWPEIITDWQRSGKSVREYCRIAGICTNVFYKMKKRQSEPEPNLVKITTQNIPAQWPLILEVCRKYRIEIRNGFSVETLKSLLSALESA